jgi:DNA-binding NtrC family response regulator
MDSYVIRLLLYSQDAALQNLLTVDLGDEFRVSFDSRMDRISALLEQRECDVLLLDLDSVRAVQQSRLYFDEIRAFDVPVVIMIEDDNRATALELARRGFYNFIRRPPGLGELRIIVRRAHQYATKRVN